MTARPALAEGSDGPRAFTDAEGRRWTVTEEPFPPAEWTSADHESYRAGYAVGWLHFTCAEMRKRLRLFPRRWWASSDAELAGLWRRATALRPGE